MKDIKGYEDISVRTFIEFTEQITYFVDQNKDITNLDTLEDNDIMILVSIIYDTNVDDILENWTLPEWRISKELLYKLITTKMPDDVKKTLEHPTYGTLEFNITSDATMALHQNMLLNDASKKAKDMNFLPRFAAILWQPKAKFKASIVDELETHFMDVPITDIYAGFFLFVSIGLEHIKLSKSYSMMDMMIQTNQMAEKIVKRKRKKPLSQDQLLEDLNKQLAKEWKKNGQTMMSSMSSQKENIGSLRKH